MSAIEGQFLSSYEALLVFFRSRLAPHMQDLAQDLAQETMLAALQALPRITGGHHHIENPTGYLLGIARHKLKDAYRDGCRRKTVPLETISHSSSFTSSTSFEEAIDQTRAIHEQRQQRLACAFARLGPREQQVLSLRYREGLSNGDAARHLGMVPEKASRLKYQALLKLRWHLLKKR